jgi:hypothetical protein
MLDGTSPGYGNHPHYDIDQQVEAVLHDAEEYNEHDDEDYEDVSIYSSDDEELSDDYSSINPASESNDVLDQDNAVRHHRAAFYKMYVPMFRSVKTGTCLITNNKYDMLVNLL